MEMAEALAQHPWFGKKKNFQRCLLVIDIQNKIKRLKYFFNLYSFTYFTF